MGRSGGRIGGVLSQKICDESIISATLPRYEQAISLLRLYLAWEAVQMNRRLVSNGLLALGALLLAGVILFEATGFSIDPLLPAFSAFLIGCTAILDRVGVHNFE